MSRVRLHRVEAGPVDGPPVILLHGFPEFSYAWRHQMPALAAGGFHAIAPDLRGYNLSPKPKCVSDYRVERLVDDVIVLIDELPSRQAILVGHDWGGVLAWYAAMWYPERIVKLAILNAPHPLAYLRELRRGPQLLRSWYAVLFQLPWLPEALLRWGDWALARRFFSQGPARTDECPDAAIEQYLGAIARPGVLTAAINYYRAAGRRGLGSLTRAAGPIRVPTLLIWGDRDVALVRRLADNLEPWVPDLRVRHLPDATHWVQCDEPDTVSRLLLEFFAELHCPKQPAPDAGGAR